MINKIIIIIIIIFSRSRAFRPKMNSSLLLGSSKGNSKMVFCVHSPKDLVKRPFCYFLYWGILMKIPWETMKKIKGNKNKFGPFYTTGCIIRPDG